MIFCNISFRGYSQNNLQKFDEFLLKHNFESIENFTKVSSSHHDPDVYGMDEHDEYQYFFTLKEVTKKISCEGTCVSIAELNCVLDQYQYELKEVDLDKNALYSFTLKSKDFYPKEFSLQSIFPVHRVVFGNIFNKNFFNPVLAVRSERKSSALQEFLRTQKSFPDFVYNMGTLFEHDQKSFSVFFNDFYGDSARVIELKVPYSSIRRIIASMSYIDSTVQCGITFQLAFPPLVFPHRQQSNGTNENDPKFFIRNRYPTWNGNFAKEEDICLSTCLAIDCYDMEPCSVLSTLDRLQKITGKEIEFGDRISDNKSFLKHRFYEKDFLQIPEMLPENLQKLKDPKYFSLVYAIESIVCRGGEVYDYFFRKPNPCFEAFLQLVSEKFESDLQREPNKKLTKTVRALELMFEKFDYLLDIPEPITFFTKCYEQLSEFESTSELIKKGFMRVRKIIVTPTRVLLCNPDIVAGNRCLRMCGSDNMIRVIFRDDNSSKLYGVQRILISKTVESFLKFPLCIAMRKFSYFCSSDSLMKDHGCYLLAGTPEDVKEFRMKCGRFKIDSIPKMMGQLGQCLTYTHKCSFEITSNDYCEVPDYVGGEDANGNPYTFSDGVGIMSREIAKKIAIDLGYPDFLPSCVEFRFRGYKGVLSIDPFADKTPEEALSQNQSNNNKNEMNRKKIMFRPSQKTFDAPRDKFMEIVKLSMPVCVALNKPLINILDQVSEKQDTVIHKKIKKRTASLLDRDINDISSTLFEPQSACIALKEFSKLIPHQLFDNFNITAEPFFHSILRSSARIRLDRLFDKISIRIPSNLGRMMFGVFDESGVLEKGQVFIRYTTDASVKFPAESADKATLIGPVLITKNSSTSAGDVRMFEAVDVEVLHELVDVVVFSGKGDRPNSNEMSGADLDGDQFKVIWDPDLFLQQSEAPYDYSPVVATAIPEDANDPNFDNTLSDLMIKTFKTFIMEDSIGTISNAHLANSDLYGIFSKTCSNIAVKHEQAVNFQQTGIIPEGLTRQPSENGMPAEKVERYPNFMAKTYTPSYKSERILGRLHEKLNIIKNILKFKQNAFDESVIVVDQSFCVPGDEIYYEAAVELYNNYSSLIQNICQSYGIPNEGCLFSHNFIALKKRLVDRDEEHSTLFTTQYMIEEQLTNIYENIRRQFFDQFDGLESNTEIDDKNGLDIYQAFSRICISPTSELRKKASAFYRVAYERKKYLSFAWTVADILMANRKLYCIQNREINLLNSMLSLENKLSEYINDLTSKFATDYDIFNTKMDDAILLRVSNDVISLPCAQICHHNKGLRKVLFFIRKWGEKQNLDGISPKILDGLVILFGSGKFAEDCEPCITIPTLRDGPIDDLENKSGGLGRIFINFIQCLLNKKFVASNTFKLLPYSKRLLQKRQCVKLHYKAMETFYPIVVKQVFDTLPGVKEDEKDIDDKNFEAEAFVIEISMEGSENYEELLKKLGEKCGCKYITIKRKSEPSTGNRNTFRVALQAVGEFWATWKFRSVLLPRPDMLESNFEERNALLGVETYNKLQFYANEENIN